jgi:hypothetical protein
MPQLLESPIPHSKEFTWFPKDLPSSFAKEVCGDKTMFFHQLLSSWSVFAAMYAENGRLPARVRTATSTRNERHFL